MTIEDITPETAVMAVVVAPDLETEETGVVAETAPDPALVVVVPAAEETQGPTLLETGETGPEGEMIGLAPGMVTATAETGRDLATTAETALGRETSADLDPALETTVGTDPVRLTDAEEGTVVTTRGQEIDLAQEMRHAVDLRAPVKSPSLLQCMKKLM